MTPPRHNSERPAGAVRSSAENADAKMAAGLQELVNSLQNHRTFVFVAPTGVGKSTRLAPAVVDALSYTGKKVACTQPRRIAALQIADCVAKMQNHPNSNSGPVSHKFKGESSVNPATKLVYCTDGSLMMELLYGDGYLNEYSCVVVDEAHERGIDTDLLISLLKYVQKKRDDLWVVIMSATLDKATFTDFFSDAVLIEVEECRRFHVDVHYLQEVPADPIAEAATRALKIFKEESDGSVLVFVAGVDEISRCVGLIRSGFEDLKKRDHGRTLGACVVYPLHAKMTKEDQKLATHRNDTVHRWRDSCGNWVEKPLRVITVSTNIAETSLTMQGLVYVIDTGFEKRMRFDPELNSEVLAKEWIDQSSANQRSGRGGRVANGVCYRLYSQEHFLFKMNASKAPNIEMGNPTTLLLRLASFGVADVTGFDFISAPDPISVLRATSTLQLLGAYTRRGNPELLSNLGSKMASTSISPPWVVSLVRAHQLRCFGFMLSCVVMVEHAQTVFKSSNSMVSRHAYRLAQREFDVTDSEHWRLVKVFVRYKTLRDEHASIKPARDFCIQCHLDHNCLEKAWKAFGEHAKSIQRSWGISVNLSEMSQYGETEYYNFIKALVRGHFMSIASDAMGGELEHFTTCHDNNQVRLSWESQEQLKLPFEWVLYSELLRKPHLTIMRCCTVVPDSFLIDEAKHFFHADNVRPARMKEKVTELREKHRYL